MSQTPGFEQYSYLYHNQRQGLSKLIGKCLKGHIHRISTHLDI